MKDKSLYLGEVVESALTVWIVQSWKWNNFPSFGSMVAVDLPDKTYFSIVYDVKIGSSDSNRTPFAYQKSESELLAEYPQIFELLRTNFHCLPLGYKERNKLFYFIPPEPAKIHAFVRPMSFEEKISFFESNDFLPIIFKSQSIFDVDEVISALVKELKYSEVFNEQKLEELVEIYNLLTGNDYKRLKMLLKRIAPIV